MILSLSVRLRLWPLFASVENNNKCKPNVQPKRNNSPRPPRSPARPKSVAASPPSKPWELVNERSHREAISTRHLLSHHRQTSRPHRWSSRRDHSPTRHRQESRYVPLLQRL